MFDSSSAVEAPHLPHTVAPGASGAPQARQPNTYTGADAGAEALTSVPHWPQIWAPGFNSF
ncbi:hypothetical protein GCM10027046_18060 [Uliginosibacterium flavum]